MNVYVITSIATTSFTLAEESSETTKVTFTIPASEGAGVQEKVAVLCRNAYWFARLPDGLRFWKKTASHQCGPSAGNWDGAGAYGLCDKKAPGAKPSINDGTQGHFLAKRILAAKTDVKQRQACFFHGNLRWAGLETPSMAGASPTPGPIPKCGPNIQFRNIGRRTPIEL